MTTTSLRPPASDAVEVAGRLGLAARGLVYLVLAALAVLVARGDDGAETDTTGALATIGAQPYGKTLLFVLAVCLLGYAVWRAAEAITGRTSEDEDAGTGERAISGLKTVIYVGLALTALRLAMGSAESGSAQQQSWTAKVLEWPGGVAIVALIGLFVLVNAAMELRSALSASFMDGLEGGGHRPAVRTLGRVGHLGRGVAFGLVGLFVLQAALEHDPSESKGLDGALAEVASRGYGPPLLYLLALGFLAFGLYSFAEARWRRIRT